MSDNKQPALQSQESRRLLYAGDKNSNWAWFEKQKSAYANINLRFTTGDLHDNWGSPGSLDQALYEARFREKGPSVIMKGFKIGVGSDFWNLYEDDIKLAAGLGEPKSRHCAASVLGTTKLSTLR